jgi:hypothetical protein
VRRVLGIATIGLFTTFGNVALAQSGGRAEDVAAARALAIEGIKLADAGNCAAAVEKLERAEALRHAPTILGRLGECQVTLGKIVLGTENLQRVVREQLAADAPQAFRDAQARAQKTLDAALPRIAKLKINVEPAGVQATVKVDGAPVPAAILGAERPTDPGSHQVEATAPGYLAASSAVRLSDGGSETVTLRLEPDPNAAAVPPQPTPGDGTAPPVGPVGPVGPQPQPQPGPEPVAVDMGGGGGSKVLPFVALGIGGVGLIVSGVTGAMASSKTKDLEELCPDKQCPPDAYDEYDSASNLATVSTISAGVGIVGIGVGVVLLLTSKGGSSESPPPVASKARPRPRGVQYQPFIGVNTAGVSGSF